MGCIVKWDADTLAAVEKMEIAEDGCVVNWMKEGEVQSLEGGCVVKWVKDETAAVDNGCVVKWVKDAPSTAALESGCVVKWDDAAQQIQKLSAPQGCFVNWMVSPRDIAIQMIDNKADDFCLANFSSK
ncbi:MAG: hypothetical protein H7Z12_16770 [Rhodospirillaceae bacterium]|nr:hypothetical protein [Rhodospirillales bacterium]